MIERLTEIRRILWEEWDPIGVNETCCPRDEYDSYADRILQMLLGGQSEVDVVGYLQWAALENMGLSEAGDVEAIARKVVSNH